MALTQGTNTYVSLAEANEYFNTRLGSDNWTSADDTNKEKALIQSARIMNEFRYVGRKVTEDQPLAFPRLTIGRTLTDAELIMYSTYTNSVPVEVKYAQCEQAIYLLEGEDNNRVLMQSGVTNYSAGGASFSLYNDGYATLGPVARHYLSPFLTRGGRLI